MIILDNPSASVRVARGILLSTSCFLLAASQARSETAVAEAEAAAPQIVRLADGALEAPLHATWKKGKPRSRIVEHEYSLPRADGDLEDGRLTIMSAGGGIEANISRWESQFKTSDGKPLPSLTQEGEADALTPRADAENPGAPLKEGKISKKFQVGDLEVHTVDLRGTFVDRPGGPVGPSVDRAGYRMLGVIIPTAKHGVWFVKLSGPQPTMALAEKGFRAMVEGLKYKE